VRIALDATYTVDRYPSGIAVYSSEILSGLAAAHPEDDFLYCYRPKQFGKAERSSFRNVRSRLLAPPFPTFRADIFHALNQRVDQRAAKAVVCTFHDLFVMTNEYSSATFRRRFAEQAKTAALHSDIIIAVSQFTADQVHELLSFPRARIRVVPHGVRVPELAPGARKSAILFVGALQIRKNLIRLLEAFERLPREWRLVLAGAPNGFGADTILDRIRRSPSQDRITLAGYVSRAELDRLYAQASIFAFPSLGEGFGIPIVEAMAHAVPVLTSNSSALAEVAGDAAILVDPRSSDAIFAGLSTLAGDLKLRNDLGERGRARAKMFSWQRAVQDTYRVYEELRSTTTSGLLPEKS